MGNYLNTFLEEGTKMENKIEKLTVYIITLLVIALFFEEISLILAISNH